MSNLSNRIGARTGARIEISLFSLAMGIVLAALLFLIVYFISNLVWAGVLIGLLAGALLSVILYFMWISNHLSKAGSYLDGLAWSSRCRLVLIVSPLIVVFGTLVIYSSQVAPPDKQLISQAYIDKQRTIRNDRSTSGRELGFANLTISATENSRKQFAIVPLPTTQPIAPQAAASPGNAAQDASPTELSSSGPPGIIFIFEPGGESDTSETKRKIASKSSHGLPIFAAYLAGMGFPPAIIAAALGFGHSDEYTETTLNIISSAATKGTVNEEEVKKAMQEIELPGQRKEYVQTVVAALKSAESRLSDEQIKSIADKMSSIADSVNNDAGKNAPQAVITVVANLIKGGPSQTVDQIAKTVTTVLPNPTDTVLNQIEARLSTEAIWNSLSNNWPAARQRMRHSVPATTAIK